MSDANVLRRLTESTDQIAPVAGVSTNGNASGSLANGAPGLSAEVLGSCGNQTTYIETDGIATDGSGNLLYAEGQENLVRVLAEHTGVYYGQSMTAGRVYTIAGNGTAGYLGDGGPALDAQLDHPESVTTDPDGNLIITATGDDRIRVVAARTGTYYGKAMTAGDIYTVYTGLYGSFLVTAAADHWGNLLIADIGNGQLYVLAAQSGTYYGRAMHAGGLYPLAPLPGNGTREESGGASIAVDTAGNVIFTDETTNLVQVVAASTGSFYGQSMTIGRVYTIAGDGSSGYNGDGILALTASMLPEGVAIDAAGNLVIADGSNNRLRVVATSAGTYYGQPMTAGDIYTVAGTGTAFLSGSGGPATAAELGTTGSSVVDASGNVLFCDVQYGYPTSIEEVHVLAAKTGEFYGLFMYKGDIYTLPGVEATSLALDAYGNILLGNSSGVLSVLAGKAGFFYKHWMVPGHIYPMPAAGNGTVAVDANGNFILGLSDNNRANGAINVFPVKNGTFYGQTMRAYHLYRLAGGGAGIGGDGNGVRALIALILNPADMVLDSSGNLVFADSGANMIRVVAEHTGTFYGMAVKAGYIYNIVGTGQQGSSGDGGPAVDATLRFSTGLAFDGAGNLIIADTFNNKIRVVAESKGTFYGRAMKAGDIYAIAGAGTTGFGGDGGPAASAWLDQPSAVTVESNGDIVVSDSGSARIRLITVG
jgi:sugar lactone lactonase YvrE